MTLVRQRVTLWGREVKIDDLQWEGENLSRITKHNVTRGEVEEACINQIYIDRTYASRLLLVGKNNVGRIISVVLAYVGKNKYYVVTARDSSRGERKRAHDQEKNK